MANRREKYVTWRWKSVLEFSTDVVAQLKEAPEGQKVRCDFDYSTHVFTLAGRKASAEESLEVLRKAAEKKFKANVIAKRKAGFVPDIQRNRLSEFTSSQIQWDDNTERDDVVKKNHCNGTFAILKKWAPKRSAEFAGILYPAEAEADVPTMIARVCDCLIQVDVIGKKCKILANDVEVLSQVGRKLDNVEAAHIKVAPDININLVQAQTLADFEIGLVKLSQQKTTIGKTTLFPEIYKQYYQLRDEIHSLRLYLFDPPTVDLPQIIKLNGKKIQGDRSQDGPRAWRAYIYHMWGSPPATLRYASPPPFSQAPAIDSNELSTALKLLPSSLHAEILDTGYASPEEPDRGYQSDGGNATLGPRPKFASENVASEMPFPTLTQRRVRIGPGAPEVVQSVNPQPTAPVEPYPSATIGLLGPRPMPSNTNQTFLVRATVRLRPTETKIPDTPVEEKEPNGPVEDRKQEVAEQDTRQMYQTSTQQKPSKKAKKLVTAREPAPYQAAIHRKFNLEQLYTAIGTGLEYVRLQRCKVHFKAKIGRIIYTKGPKNLKYVKWENFQRAISEKDYTMDVLFTDRVTTEFVDVDYFCDINLGPEKEIFAVDPESRSIWYEIHCVYKMISCKIQINAETTEMEVWGKNQQFTKVKWNCPRSSWDAEFVLEGRRALNKEDPAFAALVDSIYVEGGDLPRITFRNERQDLEIVRIFCKRETRYDVLPESLTGPGRKFELAVTEFQDLHISTFTSDETLLTAEAFERREMITAQRLWYTFAIVPVEMDNTLQAQAALEVGEFGDFTTDTMLGPTRNDSELLKALIKIVDVVIDRIDDVGYRNRGPWIE